MANAPDKKAVLRCSVRISQIKKFGQQQFGLPKTKNFSRYCPEKSGCFFVQWCSKEKIPQKDKDLEEELFFDGKEASCFCRKKEQEGLDAFVFKVPGFIDENSEKKFGSPLTPEHITWNQRSLAVMIFHEDFHVWVRKFKLKNISLDDKIEESLASIFGYVAAIFWAKEKHKKINARRFLRGTIKDADLACAAYEAMENVYQNNNLNSAEKDALKRKIFNKYQKSIFNDSSWCFDRKANFASLYVIYKYSKYINLFYKFFKTRNNLKTAMQQIEIIAKKSKSPDDFIECIKDLTTKK